MDDFPHIRKTGRYGFFAVCAVSVAMMAGVLCRLLHLPDAIEHGVVTVVMGAVFLTLRDNEKNAMVRAMRERP